MRDNRISIYPGFYLIAACAFMLVPIKWFLAWLVAAAVHELCHIIALRCMAVRILSISVCWNGIEIETEPIMGFKATVCALAGPMGNLLLLLLLPVMPRLAVCAGLQATYNLLPLYPTDGGRALYEVLTRFFNDQVAGRICRVTRNSVLFVILLSCFILAVNTGKILIPLLLIFMILVKCKKFLAIDPGSEYNSFT